MNGPTRLAVKKHSDLWFSDGSVVLRAEDTVFRVHISQLSRRSLFFRDLFSLPQPGPPDSSVADVNGPDGLWLGRDGMFEGCPLLLLHDSAEDLANLLNALYDGGPALGNNDREDFRVAAGILRLSTKYIIDSLRSKTLHHLGIAWPSTLQGWDVREELTRAYEAEKSLHRGHMYPSPIAVIELAREVDAPELLPAAFYELSKYHYAQIFEPRPGDPLYSSPSHSSPSLSSLSPSTSASTLSMRDMHCLTVGKECTQHAVTGLIQGMTSDFHRDHALGSQTHSSVLGHYQRKLSDRVCLCPAMCRKDQCELAELATNHFLFDRESGCSDPLYVADELGSLKSIEFSECKACAKSLECWAKRERERIWKMIPHWFRLV